MSVIKDSALRRMLRTGLQLVASGGLTAVVASLADGLSPGTSGVVLAGWQLVVTYVQNFLEDRGTIPVVLGTKDVSVSPGE